MRASSAFIIGQIVGAIVVGLVAGSFLDLKAMLTFSVALAVGSAASALVCRWWPGYDAPGWQLWFFGAIANPLLLVAAAFSIDSFDCLIGKTTGWACMFADTGLMVIGVCLIPPLFGVALRWIGGASPA